MDQLFKLTNCCLAGHQCGWACINFNGGKLPNLSPTKGFPSAIFKEIVLRSDTCGGGKPPHSTHSLFFGWCCQVPFAEPALMLETAIGQTIGQVAGPPWAHDPSQISWILFLELES